MKDFSFLKELNYFISSVNQSFSSDEEVEPGYIKGKSLNFILNITQLSNLKSSFFF